MEFMLRQSLDLIDCDADIEFCESTAAENPEAFEPTFEPPLNRDPIAPYDEGALIYSIFIYLLQIGLLPILGMTIRP